jgi:hypothetical protein
MPCISAAVVTTQQAQVSPGLALNHQVYLYPSVAGVQNQSHGPIPPTLAYQELGKAASSAMALGPRLQF